jgi:ABC-type oligopeptide transport system substrate-binding subunit
MRPVLISFFLLLVVFLAIARATTPEPDLKRQGPGASQLEISTPPDSKSETGESREQVLAGLTGGLNLDPVHAHTTLESQVYTAIYEGLAAYDPATLEPITSAAQRWEMSETSAL